MARPAKAETPMPSACPICEAEQTSHEFAARDTDRRTELLFDVFRCAACGSGFVSPQPPPDILSALYDDEFFSKQTRTGLLASLFGRFEDALFRRRVRFIAGNVHSDARRLLDVGCGNGKFLRAMRMAGYNVVGIEPSPAGAARAREDHQLDVHSSAVLDVDLGDAQFDLITFWHVLEHVDAPAAFLQHVSQWLAPGGRIVVAVPNYGGLEARWLGRRWAFLDIPRHLFQFTRRGLRAVADTAALEIVRDDLRLSEYGFPVTILNACSVLSGDHPLLVYNMVKRQHSYGWLRRVHALLVLAVAGLLAPLLFLAHIAVEMSHAGNGLIVVMQRRENANAPD